MYVYEFTAVQAGFFRANAHQVAFNGFFQRSALRSAAHQNIVQFIDKDEIPTAMTVATRFLD